MKKIIGKSFLGVCKAKEDSGDFLDNEQEFLPAYCSENSGMTDTFYQHAK